MVVGDSPERREDGIQDDVATDENCDKVGREYRDRLQIFHYSGVLPDGMFNWLW